MHTFCLSCLVLVFLLHHVGTLLQGRWRSQQYNRLCGHQVLGIDFIISNHVLGGARDLHAYSALIGVRNLIGHVPWSLKQLIQRFQSSSRNILPHCQHCYVTSRVPFSPLTDMMKQSQTRPSTQLKTGTHPICSSLQADSASPCSSQSKTPSATPWRWTCPRTGCGWDGPIRYGI